MSSPRNLDTTSSSDNADEQLCIYCNLTAFQTCPRCSQILCPFHSVWKRHRYLCFPQDTDYQFKYPVTAALLEASKCYDLVPMPPLVFTLDAHTLKLDEWMVYGEAWASYKGNRYPLRAPKGLGYPEDRSPWFYLRYDDSRYMPKPDGTSPLGNLVLTDLCILGRTGNDRDNAAPSYLPFDNWHGAMTWWESEQWIQLLHQENDHWLGQIDIRPLAQWMGFDQTAARSVVVDVTAALFH